MLLGAIYLHWSQFNEACTQFDEKSVAHLNLGSEGRLVLPLSVTVAHLDGVYTQFKEKQLGNSLALNLNNYGTLSAPYTKPSSTLLSDRGGDSITIFVMSLAPLYKPTKPVKSLGCHTMIGGACLQIP